METGFIGVLCPFSPSTLPFPQLRHRDDLTPHFGRGEFNGLKAF